MKNKRAKTVLTRSQTKYAFDYKQAKLKPRTFREIIHELGLIGTRELKAEVKAALEKTGRTRVTVPLTWTLRFLIAEERRGEYNVTNGSELNDVKGT